MEPHKSRELLTATRSLLKRPVPNVLPDRIHDTPSSSKIVLGKRTLAQLTQISSVEATMPFNIPQVLLGTSLGTHAHLFADENAFVQDLAAQARKVVTQPKKRKIPAPMAPPSVALKRASSASSVPQRGGGRPRNSDADCAVSTGERLKSPAQRTDGSGGDSLMKFERAQGTVVLRCANGGWWHKKEQDRKVPTVEAIATAIVEDGRKHCISFFKGATCWDKECDRLHVRTQKIAMYCWSFAESGKCEEVQERGAKCPYPLHVDLKTLNEMVVHFLQTASKKKNMAKKKQEIFNPVG